MFKLTFVEAQFSVMGSLRTRRSTLLVRTAFCVTEFRRFSADFSVKTVIPWLSC